MVNSRPARVRLVPIDPSAAGTRRVLDQAVTVLGSSEECDLIITAEDVDAAHAAVVLLGNRAYLCDLGAPVGTTLNGRRVRWIRLVDGDEMGLGSCRFRIELDEAAASGTSEEPPFSLADEETVGVVGSIDPVLVVGSDPGCDVVLHCEAVAPRHCMVVWTHEGPIVRSLRDGDPVRLNGRRIGFGRLVNGDSIGVGPVELTFEAQVGGAISDDSRQAREPACRPLGSKGRLTAAALAAGRLASNGVATLRGLWPDAKPMDDQPSDRSAGAQEHRGRPARSSVSLETERAFWEAPRKAPRTPETAADGIPPGTSRANMGFARRGESAAAENPLGALQERSRQLDQRATAWRARVAAAQQALDERARNHREDLNREREHLQGIQADLQRQAERLLRSADEGCSPPGPRRAEAVGPKPAAVAPPPKDVASSGPLVPLEQTTRELTELVFKARDEIGGAERRLDSLGADIDKLRGFVAQTQERHQARDVELAAQFKTLEKAQQSQWREREALLSKTSELDAHEAALGTRIEDAERRREDLELEARRLAEARASLDERRQDLRQGLEGARQGLKACQAELQRKKAELAKATHQKRRSVEAEIARRQAELDMQEAEIRARKAALAPARHNALGKTDRELADVLDAGLDRLETELRERQAQLDARADMLLEESGAGPVVRGPTDRSSSGSPGPKLPAAAELIPVNEGQRTLGIEGKYETLAQEIAALREALEPTDDRGSGGMPSEQESDDVASSNGRGPVRRVHQRPEADSVPFDVGGASPVVGERAKRVRDDGVWSL